MRLMHFYATPDEPSALPPAAALAEFTAHGWRLVTILPERHGSTAVFTRADTEIVLDTD